MVSRIFRATLNSAFPVLALSCVVGLASATHTSNAQTPAPAKKTKKVKKPTAVEAAPAVEKAAPAAAAKTDSPSLVKASGGEDDATPRGENLKFNTDSAPVSTDRHAPMVFKDSGEAPLGTPRKEYAETVPEDAGYKAYIGYPKHQLGVYAAPMGLSSKWTSSDGRTYNFSNSATAWGLNYRLLVTPMWSIEADYQHFAMKMEAATSTPYTFDASTASFDNYYVRNRFCMIGKTTFYNQLCPGIDIGNDGYPIVNYDQSTANHLVLTRVQDIIVGLNLAYQMPAGESLLFRIMAGYNYGTGIGNSGYLTSKNNTSYYANGGVEWTIGQHNLIHVLAEFKSRQAKVSGNVNANVKDTWETASTSFGGKVGYSYSF